MKVVLNTSYGVDVLDVKKIYCIYMRNRRVCINTQRKEYDSGETLTYWCEQLKDPCFYRTNRGCIVNMMYVSRVERDQIFFENSNITAPLTKRGYKSFLNTLNSYRREIGMSMFF